MPEQDLRCGGYNCCSIQLTAAAYDAQSLQGGIAKVIHPTSVAPRDWRREGMGHTCEYVYTRSDANFELQKRRDAQRHAFAAKGSRERVLWWFEY